MKKLNLLLICCLFAVATFAQKARTLSGEITANTTLFSDTIYTLDGYVFVKNNAVLTIQPGTVIKGKSNTKATLIITRNGSIQANGTSTMPIIMTSEKPAGARAKGDWGGLVILGKAVINRPTDCATCPGATVAAAEAGIQNAIEGDLDNANGDGLYGGNDNNHSSGTLRYVRVEFAGTVITPGNEINGMTFGGVGQGTVLEYLQVTLADDDGFEWFGGNVNAKYLVSHHNVDDDLDTDFGFSGKIQFAIVQRDSTLFDIGSGPTTNGFESDNDASGSEAQPFTSAVFSNITVVGPLAHGTALGYSNSFNNGVRIRRNSQIGIFNSVIMGFPEGVFIDGARSGNKHQTDTLLFKNNILAGNLRAINNSSFSGARTKVLSQNDSLFAASGIFNRAFNYTTPDFTPSNSSPALSGASFAGAQISDNFFTPTAYRGAIGTTNWTSCWCNFDPQNTDYTTVPFNLMPVTYDAGKDSTICSGQSVTIGQLLTGPYKYAWTPSTGLSSATAARPSANPLTNVTYYVTVTDSVTGCSTRDSVKFTVNTTPVANFTSTMGANGQVSFTNTSTGAATYAWNFGDGNTSTTASPTNTYAANGVYNVQLTAINGTCTHVTSRQVNVSGIASPMRAITGDITSNTTLYSDTIYILNGYTYVKNNAVLTIQPGTIIKGGANKASLIITRNGSIIANGTKNQPIVFTSSKPAGARVKGDWGGLVILGKAVINRPTDCATCPGATVAAAEAGIQNAIEGDLDNANGDGLYGGNDNNHSSGSLRYVRVEFAGTVITPGNEINGMTFGGVGRGTTLEYLQTSFADDDGFEWFGGNVNAKYLVSHRNVDDDLDTDFGFSGKIQFAIVQRDSTLFDIGAGPTTNGFESDNDASGSEAQPFTSAVFSNITVVGPLAHGTALGYTNSFNNGARIRRNSQIGIFNSVFMGFPEGVFIDGARSGNKHQTDTLLFKNNILAGNLRAINSSSPAGTRTKVLAENDSFATANGLLKDAFNYTTPDFLLASGSAAASGALFTGAQISDSYFVPTTYRGALSDNADSNWTNCWCNFDPQTANYTSSPINNPGATADFNAPVTSSTLNVSFTNASSNANSYLWDFGTGNGDTSTALNPSFTYQQNGTYQVRLIAKSACGNSVIVKTVVVNDVSLLPVADFTFTQSTVTGSRDFSFTNTTAEKNQTTTYKWYFGDGQTSTSKNATNNYAANGKYFVSLVATNANGQDSIAKEVTVLATSIKETAATFTGLSVYPNPTSNNVTVAFDLVQPNTVNIMFTDITGRTVKVAGGYAFDAGTNKVELNTSDLIQGVYLVRIDAGKSAITTRLVIVR